MEQKLQELQAQQSQALRVFYKAQKEMERADEVIKNLNSQISVLLEVKSAEAQEQDATQ